MRLLQISDPHLLAAADGQYRGRSPWRRLEAVLQQARSISPLDVLLISGDLCQDESLAGYVHLRNVLAAWPTPIALLPGNHDHPQLLRAALARRALIAPAVLELNGFRLVLLNSHCAGRCGGRLGSSQLAWLARALQSWRGSEQPMLIAVHHPPLPIGDAGMDAIGLEDGASLLSLLEQAPGLQALTFGHVHQYWRGQLPGRPGVRLLGCPSTLCGFGPVQPCPLGRADDPGGLWLALHPDCGAEHRLLRWSVESPDPA